MKERDEKLNGLLQEWRVTSAPPPYFREQVWKRIERAEAPNVSALEALQAWFATAFGRPAVALAYVTLLMMAGLALGFMQASEQTADWDRQLAGRYVQAVDPYQRVP